MARIDLGDVTRWTLLDLKKDPAFLLSVKDARRVSFSINSSVPIDLWLDVDGSGEEMIFLCRSEGLNSLTFSIREDCFLIFLPLSDGDASIRWDNIAPPVHKGDPAESLTVFDPRALGGESDDHSRVVQMMRYNTERRLHQMHEQFQRQIDTLMAANLNQAPTPPEEPTPAPAPAPDAPAQAPNTDDE